MQDNNQNIKLIENTFSLLDLLFENRKMGIRQMAKTSGLAKTTVFRIIKTLSNLNIVEQDVDEQYSLSLALSKYAVHINNSLNLVQVATPFMKSLAKKIGESVNLGILYDSQILVIHSEKGEAYTLQSMLQAIGPLYCSSGGKHYLAAMSEEECQQYYQHKFNKRTINTIVDYQTFKAQIPQIKQSGLAYDHEEYEYGLSCLAAAITNIRGELIAVISISGPTTRLKFKGLDKIGQTLLQYAQKLSHIEC